ncbi:tRNA lysidine(34) synthetase TilS [Rubrobacter taiwanensis]|uniref:tRNA(Ile)-lysidine synthase n=1 Tax=Rubrobacter taiwanensis TaxID=185139 RepID=A0A4R1BGE2_9ACTN|nr:tRNA lysidine(34) synthetase TilS [Rubrobacter taiwanensis]TCJ16227.1 tRNA lysidine(34) synthetase TilS [Rubrobacter taiwanensis]
MSGSLVAKVSRTAARYGMDLSRPLALVSGGPDSVALLRALVELEAEPVVLHVEHGLRGAESEADAEFVRELCGRLGVRFELRRLRFESKANLQAVARRERYLLAEEIADSHGCAAIATGHTADDVAETVLLNLARGAGLRGMGGIPPVRGRVVRPLIECSRAEVLAYLGELGQTYRTDSSNLEAEYARNRVRLEVLPVLEELHPGAGANLARAAALAREDLEALEELAAGLVRERGEEVVLEVRRLEEVPPALRRHAVRRAYRTLSGDPLPARIVAELLELVREREGTRVRDLPGGVVAAVRYGEELVLYRRREEGRDAVELRPGEFFYAGWRVKVSEADFDSEDARRSEVAYLDAGLGPYRVRLAREGDQIRPLGLGGRKRVFRAMMDRRVPRDRRGRTPVVVDGTGRVAWIFGGELGEEFRVTPRTRRALRLEVEDLHGGG